MLWHPGELGAAQAYVTGELEVPRRPRRGAHPRVRGRRGARPAAARARRPPRCVAAIRAAAGLGVLGRPPAPPASQARMRGRLHTPLRDRRAISHHYDLSNDFYQLLLDPAMAYSCGYWTSTDPAYGVAEAQRDKLDLVCRKLGLEPGTTLLDVGCGWGSLSLHAAEHFGARVTGVTIAAEQKRFIDARIAERGLQDRVEIRLQDYREVPERDHFDAVGSLEMGEHVGEGNYPTYVEVLRRSVKPGGRVLVQQMSRAARPLARAAGRSSRASSRPTCTCGRSARPPRTSSAGGSRCATCTGCASTTCWTVQAWLDTFEQQPAAARRAGRRGGRPACGGSTWPAGCCAFRDGRMGVDQLLCVRPGRRPHAAAGPLVVTDLLRRRRSLPGRRRRRDDRHGARGAPARPRQRRRRDLGPRAGRRRRGLRAALADVGGLAAGRPRRGLGGAAVLAHPAAARAVQGEDPRYAAMLGGGGFGGRDPQGVRGPGCGDLAGVAAAPGRRVTDVAWWLVVASASPCGPSACSSRSSATPSSRRTAPAARPAAAGAGHRAVGLDPPPQLLRRRLRLVGHLAGRRRRRRLAAGLSPWSRPSR